MSPPSDPRRRFTSRVADYVRARPGYPVEVVSALRAAFDLDPGATIADVGAGTGIASELFLRHGYRVVAVEPNDAMRAAMDERLEDMTGFRSVVGGAENTSLAPGSVDAVVAAQAFHWFDRPRFREESLRILKPGGVVALVWNARRAVGPFGSAYEDLLRRFAIDYETVRHEDVSDLDIEAFFGSPPRRWTFDNRQVLDFEGLTARLLSSSYTPPEAHPARAPMLAALREIFEANAENGRVVMEYDCGLHAGPLAA